MKTSTIPQRARGGRVLRYLLFIFMFIQIFMLYSCAVGFRTPRHERGGVIIEGSDRGGRHDNGRHNGEYRNDDDRH